MAKQDTSTKENQSFEGFPLPQYTQIPNLIIDFIMPDVSGNEFKVLLYIARRTLGFHKERDTVSLSQLVSGIKTRAGESLNRGTGLSKATVARCLNGLEQQGYIERVRRQDALRGFLPTEYRLKFKKMSAPQPLSQNETSPLVSERDKPLSQNETYKRNNKQKKQQHVVVALTNNGENPSISVNTKVDKIKTMLAQKKIRGELANKIANEYSEEYVQQKIDYLDFLLEYQPNQVERPAGWLRKAIEEDYGAPDGYKTKEEIEVVEKKKLAAEKAREARRASFEGERTDILDEQEKRRDAAAERLSELKKSYGMDTELERKWTGVQDSLAARYPHSMHSRIFTSDAHLLAIDKDRAVIAVPNKGSILVGQKAERAVLAELKNWGMQTTRIEYEILVCFL